MITPKTTIEVPALQNMQLVNVPVPAIVRGELAIHRNITMMQVPNIKPSEMTWNVTHVPTGRAVGLFSTLTAAFGCLTDVQQTFADGLVKDGQCSDPRKLVTILKQWKDERLS